MKFSFKLLVSLILTFFLTAGAAVSPRPSQAGSEEPTCDVTKSTVCTIEIWLAHGQKKNNKDIRKTLSDRPIKVLRKTIQYWRARGGHPPTNIAIGNAISAEDARWLIDLAMELNDGVTMLVIQRLNPPNYAAIGTSAWDEKSLIDITPEDLEKLRDPALSTEQFHKLYLELTGEANIPQAFY